MQKMKVIEKKEKKKQKYKKKNKNKLQQNTKKEKMID